MNILLIVISFLYIFAVIGFSTIIFKKNQGELSRILFNKSLPYGGDSFCHRMEYLSYNRHLLKLREAKVRII